MKKPAEYRRHAEECRKLAVGALSKEDRANLLDMAETWVNLATAREEMLARYPELDTSAPKAVILATVPPVTLSPITGSPITGSPVTGRVKGEQTSRVA